MSFPTRIVRSGTVSALGAALILAACASSDVAAIKGATSDQISAIRITDITVAIETPKPYPGLPPVLRQELEQAMPRCAKGTADHRMEVVVTDFDEQNVAKTVLIGDDIELAGKVRLIDAATGEPTGEYFVEASFFWGGFLGAAMMSEPERKLSRSFAEEVCDKVFGVKIKKEAG